MPPKNKPKTNQDWDKILSNVKERKICATCFGSQPARLRKQMTEEMGETDLLTIVPFGECQEEFHRAWWGVAYRDEMVAQGKITPEELQKLEENLNASLPLINSVAAPQQPPPQPTEDKAATQQQQRQ